MNRKTGFTLVELLVVMAIIAILASIVVPNVQRYIVRARVTRAVAEVSGMELSLTAIMTDAGRGNFGQIFIRDAIRDRVNWEPDITSARYLNPDLSVEMFNTAADIYSRIAYDLLRFGRDCLRPDTDTVVNADIIERDILSKLGTNYMDVALDPWGQVYRVWPGPWRFSSETHGVTQIPGGRWPIPFRVFSVETAVGTGASAFAVQQDAYTLLQEDLGVLYVLDPSEAQTWPSRVNLPAQANKSVFIWSLGQNTRSSQMLYKAVYNENDPNSWFYQEMEEDIGGGDDINNWDSGNSWQRFYM